MMEVDSPIEFNLDWDNVGVGKLLGAGSFARVYEAKLLKQDKFTVLDDCFQISLDEQECRSRALPTQRSTGSEANDQTVYALKTLLNNDGFQTQLSQAAIAGIKFEAELLSELPRQEHIIHLIGVSSNLLHDPKQGGFLILEHLTETLDHRLRRWKTRKAVENHGRSILNRALCAVGHGNDPEQHIRIKHIGLGVAKAMSFLHQRKVVYRDLKPSNIGFTASGQVKLFDFGLARKLNEDISENRVLTMQVGTLRYMSPELFQSNFYSFSTDVYSFAILLWEIITLEKPFGKARSLIDLSKMAFLSGRRPNLLLVHSQSVRQLLKSSWDPSPGLRPSFALIVAQLVAQSSKKSKICPAA